MKTTICCALVISTSLFAQDNSPSTVGENYTKKEVHIKMRMEYRFTPLSTRQKTTLRNTQ
jgi:hypothetical protein